MARAEALATSALTEPAARGIVVNSRDVTEQLAARRSEMERDELLLPAAKLASLGTLVSGIAYEINNPNSFIRLNADNLRELWEEVGRHLDTADQYLEPALRRIPYRRFAPWRATCSRGCAGGPPGRLNDHGDTYLEAQEPIRRRRGRGPA